MLRIFGLVAGFGLLLLLVKGVVFFLPLLAILFFFRMVVGGLGPFGSGRLHRAYAFGPRQHGYRPRNDDRYTNRYDGCSYGSRSEYDSASSAEQHAATGPTVRL